MSLFDSLFGGRNLNRNGETSTSWETLTAYRPAFSTWGGELYENELIRASVDALARHTSKLKAEFTGSAKGRLRAYMRYAPNSWQTWPQFLYRARTIYEMNNNLFIVPVLDEFGELCGFYPVLPTQCEIVSVGGEPYLKYHFKNGKTAAIEMARCAVVTKHQYKDDFFGEKNTALNDTMNLVSLNSQGIREGIKNGATYRFMAKLMNFAKPEDIRKERERFNRESFQGEGGGVLLTPNTWSDLKQIENKPFVISAEQTAQIQINVFNYFGVNTSVLQNSCFGDAWTAFYEGAIEPFAIALGDGMARMAYTQREVANGNNIIFTANRLQYLSNKEKLAISAQMIDRGVMSRNEVREIWNLPPIDDEKADEYIMLAEYIGADGTAPEGAGRPKENEPNWGDDNGDQTGS